MLDQWQLAGRGNRSLLARSRRDILFVRDVSEGDACRVGHHSEKAFMLVGGRERERAVGDQGRTAVQTPAS